MLKNTHQKTAAANWMFYFLKNSSSYVNSNNITYMYCPYASEANK